MPRQRSAKHVFVIIVVTVIVTIIIIIICYLVLSVYTWYVLVFYQLFVLDFKTGNPGRGWESDTPWVCILLCLLGKKGNLSEPQ